MLALLAGAPFLPGCGSDEEGEPIPAASAQEIERQLDAIRTRIINETPEDCQAIEDDSFPAIQRAIDSLPADVDADTRDALEESLAHLQDLVSAKCSDVKEPETETETTPTETVTVETETVPETETETQPTETAPTTDEGPDDGGGPGGGGPGGGDPDGGGGQGGGGTGGGSGQGGGTPGPGGGEGD